MINAYVFGNVKWNTEQISSIQNAYVYLQNAKFLTNFNYDGTPLLEYTSYEQFEYVDVEDQSALLKYTYSNWSFSVNNAETITKYIGKYTTSWFFRLNSNIYRNIYLHLYNLYHVQDQLLKFSFKQTNDIIQLNHQLSLYDLVYLDTKGFYRKALATEEKYGVIGIVSKIINNNEFILTTSGRITIPNTLHDSDSGIVYLSDKHPGKFCYYEDIDNTFYTPVGFISKNNDIIINILDSSVGDTLKIYRGPIIANNLNYISQQDKIDIISHVQAYSNL